MENADTRLCWGTPSCLPPPDPPLPQDGSTAAPPTRRPRHRPRPPSTSAATGTSPRATTPASRTRAPRTRTPSPTASASGGGGRSGVSPTPYSPSLRSTRKHARQPAPARRRLRRRVCPASARPRGDPRPHHRGPTRASTSFGRVSPPWTGLPPRSYPVTTVLVLCIALLTVPPELQNIPRGTPQSVLSFLTASPPRLALNYVQVQEVIQA